jgi:glutamate-1-semialdehyde 2,1-aminomutase
MTRAEGSRIWDVDGNEYIDFHAGFGSVLLGHNAPPVREAIDAALNEHGVTFATANPLEVELAERVVEMVPSAENVVFACTGTEATYHALRLARAVTGRDRILKFEGHYHGWHDYVAWSVRFDPALAGESPAEPVPVPGSAGIMRAVAESMVVRQYNDIEGFERAVIDHGDELAAVIMEPIYLNGGVILPEPGFLEACRQLCTEAGIVLIFDEVITGFRLAPGGAQQLTGVLPDLTTMGKAVANGFPVSILAGRRDLLSQLVPIGDVLFAGTFAGHLLNMAAGLACTDAVRQPGFHAHLDRIGGQLEAGINAEIEATGVKAQFRRLGSVWNLYFTDRPLRNYRDIAPFAGHRDDELQAAYRRWMLEHGIYIHPHYILRGYITAAHTEDDMAQAVSATGEFFRRHARLPA